MNNATTAAPALNADQEAAVSAMEDFLSLPGTLDEPFFLLIGPAGTGKTFCIKELIPRIKGRIAFTAPTNKATKVLRESVTTREYKPECRTIYSLLGLKLETSGEIKEISTPEEQVDLTKYKCVVVDEGSMLNSQVMTYIKRAAYDNGVRFIIMADFCQLPPVKETASAAAAITRRAELTKVMRHDNDILALVTDIRGRQNHPAPSIKLASANDGSEGVWVLGLQFSASIRKAAQAPNSGFLEGKTKAIAWRNITVDSLNKEIRGQLFPSDNGYPPDFFLPTDRVTLLSPAKDLQDEPMASTDDEGTVNHVSISAHPKYPLFTCWCLSVTLDTGAMVSLWTIHPSSLRDFGIEKERLAAEARANGKLWRRFWEFSDAFHSVRHAYATTAHRAQGSTYDRVYVDWRDILLNRDRKEAFKCLYVACSRPRQRLFLN